MKFTNKIVSTEILMPIQPPDVKMLWGNAASRCSMETCRKPLIIKNEEKDVPSDFLIGEMAHIVGEKNSKRSPRGVSKLPVAKRNLYSNLILLCPNHHTEIDKNESDWPIERLHVMKRDHEIWVDTQLGKAIDEQDQVYHELIDHVALAFHLKNWEWLCDHLFRQIMPVGFPEDIYHLDFEYFRAILPGRDKEFEEKLRNLVVRAREYVDHYVSDAVAAPGDTRIMARKRYRDVPETEFALKDKLGREHDHWERNCSMLLYNMVHAINEFAESARKRLRPNFFHTKKFCMHDFMGLMGGSLTETWYLPDRYFTDEELSSPPNSANGGVDENSNNS